MEWDNVLGLSSAQKAPPRKGRRAGLSLRNSREDEKSSPSLFEDRLENSNFDSSPEYEQHPVPPPRARRAGGWADEAIKSGKKRGDSSNLLERQRFQSPDRIKRGYDSDEDIPLIPELDDIGDEDLKPRAATSVAMNRVATYKELDAAGAPYLKIDNIDLSMLAKYIDMDNDQSIDEDKPLSWDQLFTDVSSRLRNDPEYARTGSGISNE